MSSSKRQPEIVFCGLARNVKSSLIRHEPAFLQLKRAFPRSKWIIVENDSSDGTRQLLDRWAEEDPRVRVIGEHTGELTIPRAAVDGVHPGFSHHRISRMANFRNQYLCHIEHEIGWEHVSNLVVIDFDIQSFSVNRLIDWIRRKPTNEVVTSFGWRWQSLVRREVYDAYAYRQLGDFSSRSLQDVLDLKSRLYSLLQGKELIEVRSNFNGLGLYPGVLMKECRYEVLLNHSTEIECECEHVSLHDQLRERGAKIFVDPALRVAYESWFRFFMQTQVRRWASKTKKLIGKFFAK